MKKRVVVFFIINRVEFLDQSSATSGFTRWRCSLLRLLNIWQRSELRYLVLILLLSICFINSFFRFPYFRSIIYRVISRLLVRGFWFFFNLIVGQFISYNSYSVFRRSIPQNFEEYVVTVPWWKAFMGWARNSSSFFLSRRYCSSWSSYNMFFKILRYSSSENALVHWGKFIARIRTFLVHKIKNFARLFRKFFSLLS